MEISIKRLEDLFETYFPEGKYKNMTKCFISNYYLYKKSEFKTSYKNGYFIVTYDDNKFIFCEYPSTDFFHAVEGYLKEYMIKDGDIVIDCGAYQGTFSILASKLVGERGLVIAFEPDTTNYKKLIHNLKINNISNVKPINKGLWSTNKILNFRNNYQGSSFFYDYHNNNLITKVPVVSLDEELANLEINKVDFIKADIEGSEIELINGSKNILLNNNVNLAIASYHELDGNKTHIKLEKILKKLNYTSKTEFPYHLTTYAKRI
ncbi:FkbM family methyltransferase [Methanobacterium sp.]|uniref:FkbM family methyltransferase n=1 Tax=Methanobacterium sp. TaxID=2164 RepID=UPI003C75468F